MYFWLDNMKITAWKLLITCQYYSYVLYSNVAYNAVDTIAAASDILAQQRRGSRRGSL